MFCRRLGANSGLIGTFWRTENGEIRPRRTGDKGQYSGIRYLEIISLIFQNRIAFSIQLLSESIRAIS